MFKRANPLPYSRSKAVFINQRPTANQEKMENKLLTFNDHDNFFPLQVHNEVQELQHYCEMDIKIEIKEENPLPDSFTEVVKLEFKTDIAGPFRDDCSLQTERNDCDLMKINSDSSQMHIKAEIKDDAPSPESFTEDLELQFKTDIAGPFSDDCSSEFERTGCNFMKLNSDSSEIHIKDVAPLPESFTRDLQQEFKTDIVPLPSCRYHKTTHVISSQEEKQLPSKETIIGDRNFAAVKSPRLTSEKVSQDKDTSCSSLPPSDLREHCPVKEVVTGPEVAGIALGIISYKCDTCKKSFKWKSHLKQHILLHSGIRPYKCDICKKSFKDKFSLARHAVLHSNARPYKCDLCEKCFKQKSNLEQHLWTHSDIRSYKCDKCKKSFKQKSVFYRHVRLHTDARSYKCDRCEKSFKDKCSLDRHVALHSNARPYKCEICEKSFKEKSNLYKHLRTHSDLRPYKCDRCEKSFTQKSYLNRHVQLHSDSKRYKCDRCEKHFKWKSCLDYHVLLHSGLKPFKCNRCEKSFNNKSSLGRHVLSHSNIRPKTYFKGLLKKKSN